MGIINNVAIAELCKGSTTDSDSVCLGSNPSSAAKKPYTDWCMAFLFFRTRRCKLFFIARWKCSDMFFKRLCKKGKIIESTH